MKHDNPAQGVRHLLRRALPEDADRIAVLGTYVWLDTYASDGVSDDISGYLLRTFSPAACRARIQDPDSAVIVAEVATSLVGFLVLRYEKHFTDATIQVETLYVQPSHARAGIGTDLLTAARELARERTGKPVFWLTVHPLNSRAIRFYHSLGLTEEGTTYFELGGAQYENLAMVSRTWGANA